MGHVVWDWNGTLLDDLDLLVEATSSALAALGEGPVDVDLYRTHHQRPLTRFYASILGREVTQDEWMRVGDAFYASYSEILPRAGLAADAALALAEVERHGFTQSILSMWLHDQLGPLVEKLELARFFQRIDGLEERDLGTKADFLERHISRLEADLGRPLERSDITIIGDTMDDGHAAHETGIKCVLVATGAQHLEDLETVGWPVAPSLLAGLELVFAPEAGYGDEG